MAQQLINRGAFGNDPDADTLRAAYGKANDNFTELYGWSNNIGKRFVIPAPPGGAAVTLPYVVGKINTNTNPYVISEKDTPVYFTVAKGVDGGSELYIYQFQKGKGSWGGIGNIAGQVNTSMFFVFPVVSVTITDIEDDPATQFVDFELTGGQTVSEWLNVQTPGVVIQSQADGYTIFNDDELGLSYLWVGLPGTYGAGLLQSVDADFQELDRTSPAPGTPNADQVAAAGNVIINKDIHFTDVVGGVEYARHSISRGGDKYRGDGFTQDESFEIPVANVSGKRVAHRQFYKKVDVIPVDTLGDIVFPATNAFYEVKLDTNFSTTPQLMLYYSDGTATEAGELYTFPLSKLNTLI